MNEKKIALNYVEIESRQRREQKINEGLENSPENSDPNLRM